MFESVGKGLEWLSKYGLIDIIFGIGIFTYISKYLKRKTKSDIIGIDLLPTILENEKVFVLGIKNQSSQPIYLYQAYIRPGYYKEEFDKTSFSTMLKSAFYMTWKTDKFPVINNRPKTTKGLYILQVRENDNNFSPTLFVGPFQYGEYILEYDELNANMPEKPNEIFEKKEFGTLKLQFVHGTNWGNLEMKL